MPFLTAISPLEEAILVLVVQQLAKLRSYALDQQSGSRSGLQAYDELYRATELHHELWQVIARRRQGELIFQQWLERLECGLDWLRTSDFDQLNMRIYDWLREANEIVPTERVRRMREAASLKAGAALVERHQLSAGVCRYTMADAITAATTLVPGLSSDLALSIDGNGTMRSIAQLTSGDKQHDDALGAFVIASLADRLHREVI